MPRTIVVVATVHPEPDTVDQVIDLFEKSIERVQQEYAGCELYAMHTEADTIVAIEKWGDASAHQAHLNSPAMNDMNAAVAELPADKTVVTVLQPHPAGDERGAR